MNPGPLLNIRNTTLYCSFTVLYFSATINKNTKTYLLSANINKNPKRTLLFCYLLLCYFIYCFYLSLIILIRNLVLDNHTVELGAQDKNFVLQVARRGWRRSALDPRVFDINPRVTLVGKTRLLHHSALGVPTSWHSQSWCHQEYFLAPLPGIYSSITAASSSSLVQTPKLGEVAPL